MSRGVACYLIRRGDKTTASHFHIRSPDRVGDAGGHSSIWAIKVFTKRRCCIPRCSELIGGCRSKRELAPARFIIRKIVVQAHFVKLSFFTDTVRIGDGNPLKPFLRISLLYQWSIDQPRTNQPFFFFFQPVERSSSEEGTLRRHRRRPRDGSPPPPPPPALRNRRYTSRGKASFVASVAFASAGRQQWATSSK